MHHPFLEEALRTGSSFCNILFILHVQTALHISMSNLLDSHLSQNCVWCWWKASRQL